MLQEQTQFINFAQGLELKTDPKQVPAGKFLNLQNTVFNKGGLLQKRNGFGELTLIPSSTATYLTTFNGNLTAISGTINAFAESSNEWVSKGTIQPLSLSTLPLIRSNTNQSYSDICIANGFICTAYTDQTIGSLTTPLYKYAVADAITGQNIISPTPIPANGGGVLHFSPRVFTIGQWFIIIFTNEITATYHLQYIAVNIHNPTIVTAPVDISTSYDPSTTLAYDAIVVADRLFVSYNTSSGGQAIKTAIISSTLGNIATVTLAAHISTMFSITVDMTANSPVIYISFYDSGSSLGYTYAINTSGTTLMAPVLIIPSGTILNLASAAQNGKVDVFYEVSNAYGYDSGVPTNYISHISVTLATSTASSPYVVIRSVGLASKACIVNGAEYFLATYNSTYQPTYFLIDGSTSTSASPVVVGKLAYENGGGYLTTGLPNILIDGSAISVPYLFKDLVQAVNKDTNVPTGTQTAGIYSQTGINYATFTLGTQEFDAVEIGSALQMSGGFLWMYDGYLPVEQNFFLFPDNVEATSVTTGGNLTAQIYYYQVIYEWTDNQGNAHQSAPSIPTIMDIHTSGTSTNTNTVFVPTLRLTYKTANPVKAVIFRWSTAQQEYYQVTSISLPLLNSTTTDSVSFIDTFSDATILGNSLIYTTGGVVEDVNAPASNIMTLWQTRLFLVDAEDQNLIWFSKQVIENTPVEMSDLFTIYIAPTIGASGSTGPITALGAMDDKLIIFKKDAIYYISGTGPDNTGSNNLFTDPIFITSVVGCTNQQSIVLTPNGLMFQSDKGIWLLDRSLQTAYIGAPVEPFTLTSNVLSAVIVPATNQVRFTLDSGITLMYDYYYQDWSTFFNIPGISSCIYKSLHTYLDKFGRIFQETPDQYLDGTSPVLISFTTSWLNLAGIQGYQRIKKFSFVGDYLSPHFLDVQVGYNFFPPTQQSTIKPTNFTGVYGSDSLYGQTSPYGGHGSLEQWKVNTKTQKCQVFQVTVNEVFNPAFGGMPGAGFTLSGINCLIAVKKGFRPFKASNTV